jgi:hypothetical protein
MKKIKYKSKKKEKQWKEEKKKTIILRIKLWNRKNNYYTSDNSRFSDLYH